MPSAKDHRDPRVVEQVDLLLTVVRENIQYRELWGVSEGVRKGLL